MNRFALPLIVIVLVAAACGGGASSSNAPNVPGASSASPAAPAASADPAPSTVAGSASGPIGSTVKACDLLTDADILELTDLTVIEAQPQKTMGVWENGCEWSLGGDAASSATAITFGILVPGGRAMWERSFKPFGEEMGMEDIEGLGDEAQLGEIDDVIAVQGDALVALQFLAGFGMSDDVPVELTRRVLENLAGG